MQQNKPKTMLNLLRSIFAPPDPMRFAGESTPPPNWFGELEKVPEQRRDRAILVNEATNTFEFGQPRIDIPEHLTAKDCEELRKRGLNPDNPAYAACKRYFSKMPYCSKADLAANSEGQDFEGITQHTAKDVLAAFRAFLVDKPTF